MWAGLAVALGLALPSYWTLALAFRRSNHTFFSTFAGGTLFRLLGLAVAAFLTYRTARGLVATVMLACVGGLILLSFIEVYFLQKEV